MQLKIEDIPERERWIWENPKALKDVQEGIADLDSGRVHVMDKEIQEDIQSETVADRIGRAFNQAETGETTEIPVKYIEFDEDEECLETKKK